MPDDIDAAQERADQFNSQAVKAARSRIVVRAALSDGICKSCRMEIEPERLVAHPGARLCLDCADFEAEEALRLRRAGAA